METDMKRLMALRDSLVREREQKIGEYEQLLEGGETLGLSFLSDSINLLTEKISGLDEKIGVQ